MDPQRKSACGARVHHSHSPTKTLRTARALRAVQKGNLSYNEVAEGAYDVAEGALIPLVWWAVIYLLQDYIRLSLE